MKRLQTKYQTPLILVVLLTSCSLSSSDDKLESISLSMGPVDARHIQWKKTEVWYLDDSKRDVDEIETFYTRVFKFDRDRFESISRSILSSELVGVENEESGSVHGPWVCLELHYTTGEVKKWRRIYPNHTDFLILDSLLNFSGDFLRKESRYFQISTAECGRAPAPPEVIINPLEIDVRGDSVEL